jgi:hypothetical protein
MTEGHELVARRSVTVPSPRLQVPSTSRPATADPASSAVARGSRSAAPNVPRAKRPASRASAAQARRPTATPASRRAGPDRVEPARQAADREIRRNPRRARQAAAGAQRQAPPTVVSKAAGADGWRASPIGVMPAIGSCRRRNRRDRAREPSIQTGLPLMPALRFARGPARRAGRADGSCPAPRCATPDDLDLEPPRLAAGETDRP